MVIVMKQQIQKNATLMEVTAVDLVLIQNIVLDVNALLRDLMQTTLCNIISLETDGVMMV